MDQLVNFIIRPPRAEYCPKNDLLDQEFMLKGKWCQRKDLEVINSRGHVLRCSHYMPLSVPSGRELPCVIYCHGNSGCRADASEAAIILLPSNITVFTLDFSGSGLSDGDHVSLGWHEKDDLKAVVEHLRTVGNVSCIGLWGRSMGAVTSLMYGVEDPSIAGMVLDSPFSNLVDLMMELVDTYRVRLPKFTVKFAIQYMRKIILKKAKFDIMELNAIQVAKSCFVPALFGHAVDDDFIRPHHSDHIYDSYVGDKNIIKFEGDHNSPRPQFYFDSITIFFHNVLNPPKDAPEGTYFHPMQNYYGKDSWDAVHKIASVSPMDPSQASEFTTGSTEDAINHLRSKRPMSRTDVPSDIPTEDGKPGALDKVSEHDLGSSSSGLITFDFSSGHYASPLIPKGVDDEYVEYSFDSFSPSNMEDEERMFMEAVIESLKDFELRHPNEVAQSPDVTPLSTDSSQRDSQDASMSSSSCTIETASSSTTASSNDSCIHGPESVPARSPDSLASPMEMATAVNHPNDETSKTVQGSSGSVMPVAEVTGMPIADADVTGITRATLTVQKSATNHVLDGLVHRWGLNFFRNSG